MLNKPHRMGSGRPGGQAGALLIEVLVAVLLLAFALLGLASMQARASSIEFEALQRSQALVLVDDMVSRMSLNRANAGDYVTAGLIGAGAVVDCSSLVGAAKDLCEWSNQIRGSTETRAGARVGSMLAARGCIARAAATTHLFVVSVTWQGVVPTGAPAGPCGGDDPTYPDPALRRMVSSTVCVALLRDTDPGPVVARC
jgi:type IV pilus assembly protein PilV